MSRPTQPATPQQPPAPVRLIIDTDMARDVDDVGALAVAHALALGGEAELLALIVSCRHAWTVACASAINTYYGRPDLPIGVIGPHGIDDHSPYARGIAEEFPHPLSTCDDAEDGLRLYRRTLAAQPDGSVVLVSIGFLTLLRDLLQSPPDDLSPLSGRSLVQRKLRHWVCMGGVHPSGTEFNLRMDPAAAQEALAQWPTSAHFCGLEIGSPILTGRCLASTPTDNPVRRAYELYFNGELRDRPSWDQATVLYAVRGLGERWTLEHGYAMQVSPLGDNHWESDGSCRHAFLAARLDPRTVADEISALMQRQPVPVAAR